MNRFAFLPLILIPLVAGPARAVDAPPAKPTQTACQSSFRTLQHLDVAFDQGAVQSCASTPSLSGKGADQDQLQISLAQKGADGAPHDPKYDFALSLFVDGKLVVTWPKGSASPPALCGDFAGKSVVLAKGEVKQLPAQGTWACGTLPPPPSDAKPAAVTDIVAATNAVDYLKKAKIEDHPVKGKIGKRTFKLYHLPDGNPAFPLPAHISEKDEVQLVVLAPEGAHVSFEVNPCDAPPAIRVLGSFSEATATITSTSKKLSLGVAPSIVEVPYGRTLKCAGTLTYKITVRDGAQAVTGPMINLPIDQVYRLSFGVGVVFDFGKPVKLSLQDRTPMPGTTEKYVAQSNDYSGIRPIVMLGYHYCGANPLDWKLCDRLPAPFIAVDPAHLTDGFMVGLNLEPYPGIGLTAGVSVFKSEVPDGNAQVDKAWTAAGDVTKHTTFNSDSVGGFLGLGFTTELLKRILPGN